MWLRWVKFYYWITVIFVAYMIWPRMTKFGTVTRVSGSSMLPRSQHTSSQHFWDPLRSYVQTVWPRATKFGTMTWKGAFVRGQPHPILKSEARARHASFCDFLYICAHWWWKKTTKFCMVRPRMLTRDLFAIANLLVDIRQRWLYCRLFTCHWCR